ncbi:Protein CSF1 [Ceratobasidium theobromae]|uniref:Protein CSF1 n=1 Tax=Ceratobasidium theobromae TaxID=1582974 RepID=A0A5N5QFV7_9AGAM|nr:Protein CSF1 [Ceratobasidium theobromae]
MPGPNEPNDYALDQMLEPLIDDLLRLKQVYGELTQHIADLIAHIKMGGGAGVKSELNFCLYCHTQLSSLSMQAGFQCNNFRMRNQQEDLNNAYHWKSLPTQQEQRDLFKLTGNRFTALHRLPGWHTSTSSPLDTMHLLYLGGMNWIVKQVLVGPGMLSRRHPGGEEPQDLFNKCLDSMWVPKNFQQLPPKIGQTRATTKADQWKLTAQVIFVPLFQAFRDGDEIRPVLVPRGNLASPAAKHQAYRAKLLHQQRRKYYASIGQLDQCPRIEECFASRNVQFHYQQVLRFCLATSILEKRTITPVDITFATGLLETMCKDYTAHNIPLSPNFHYMMHLEEFLLKTGSVYNTHVWGMERANGILSHVNHNGKSGGVLEGTLMRSWWSTITVQNLIKNLQALPNPTPADNDVINDLLEAVKSGNEQAQQQGSLMAFIAQCQTEYTQLYGIQVSTRLSKQSCFVNLESIGLYEEVVQFCEAKWPGAGIFGPGMPQEHYLAPNGMVRNHSYVEFNGIRYGSHKHTSGKGYCYGYIDQNHPVQIEYILVIKIPGTGFDCTCVFVRQFQVPEVEANFPWDAWAQNLCVASWAYGQLGDPIAIEVNHFSGAFALFDIPMRLGRYWVTVALDNIGLQQNEAEENE